MDDLEAFERDLNRHADDLHRKAGVAVRAATLQTEALGKGFSPVLTGFLKASITSEFSSTADSHTGETGPEAQYAHWVHGGTSRMAPRPFMFRAAEIVEPQFYTACEVIAAQVGGSVTRGG